MSTVSTGGIAQCRFINRVLESKDPKLVTNNNIDESFFSDYPSEFRALKKHIEQYGNVPDKLTFLDAFPQFAVIEVSETDDFVVNSLYEDRTKRLIASNFNKVRDLIQSNDVEGSVQTIMQLIPQFSHANKLRWTSYTKDLSRYDQYVTKCTTFDAYYVTTGFRELDAILGGWDRKEEYVTFVARTNMGKTWVALKTAAAAGKAGLRVGIYSGEMGKNKVGYRMDTIISNISNKSMTHGITDIQDTYKDYIQHINEQFKTGGEILILTPEDNKGVPMYVSTLKMFIEQANLDMLIIDQHSLLEDERHGRDPVTRAANISKDIKLMQVATKIPIITVSQQNRTASETGTPNTTQIAQSDRIGQDSTIVIFFEQKDGIASLTLGKSRDSEKDKVLKYVWDIDHGIWQFLPEETDATGGADCEALKDEYEDDSGEGFA